MNLIRGRKVSELASHGRPKNRAHCVNGHYVCNECHTKGMDAVIGYCLNETSKNPVKILDFMMNMPFCHMHGPAHHTLVDAGLLTAYRNAGSHHYPKQVDRYLNEPWDYVITVCGGARETCPLFSGEVRHRLHIGFDDPDAFTGTPEEIITEFRRVRDEIRISFQQLAQSIREETTHI